MPLGTGSIGLNSGQNAFQQGQEQRKQAEARYSEALARQEGLTGRPVPGQQGQTSGGIGGVRMAPVFPPMGGRPNPFGAPARAAQGGGGGASAAPARGPGGDNIEIDFKPGGSLRAPQQVKERGEFERNFKDAARKAGRENGSFFSPIPGAGAPNARNNPFAR